ncbi:MAG TPA: diaminopimelate epimerase [Actinobacteria bacterium]|nr:diaminopimelate epimerase [bacterium BMS3Bbin01]HDH27090.1 diaminopimelate epimerase [Actinomycetota bacterium]
MRFTKMEGLGNDFVVLQGPRPIGAEDVKRLCDRRRGVGADGVLVVSPIDAKRIRMQYWNADGSPAELCGNGMRCAAAFAVDRALVEASEFTVETAAGPREARVGEDAITVELGTVRVATEKRRVSGKMVREVTVGNPHVVLQVPGICEAAVATLGPSIEAAFEDGVNVEFLSVRSPGLLELRVWERGVGETLACGTGAAAAAAAARVEGLAGSETMVRLPGGDLNVLLDGDRAWISGPAAFVYEGEWRD